jgi:hypothetical protein
MQHSLWIRHHWKYVKFKWMFHFHQCFWKNSFVCKVPPPLLYFVSWFPDITNVLEEPAASSFRVKGSGRWVRFGGTCCLQLQDKCLFHLEDGGSRFIWLYGVTSQETLILLLVVVKISYCNKPTGFVNGGKGLILSSFLMILFLGILCRLLFKCSAKFEICMGVQSHWTTHWLKSTSTSYR